MGGGGEGSYTYYIPIATLSTCEPVWPSGKALGR